MVIPHSNWWWRQVKDANGDPPLQIVSEGKIEDVDGDAPLQIVGEGEVKKMPTVTPNSKLTMKVKLKPLANILMKV